MRNYLIASFLSLLFISCQSDMIKTKNPEQGGGFLRYSETSSLNGFFPHSIADLTTSRLISQIYDGLVKIDLKTMKIMPNIARKWDISDDGLTYTFYLKNNVYFHDDDVFPKGNGRKVTAKDVIYSFKLLSTNDINNKNFKGFTDLILGKEDFAEKGGIKTENNIIEGLKAINDSVVEIKLNKASGAFLFNLANPVASIIPEEGFKKYGYNNYIGTGPFYVSDIENGMKSISLLRFPYYHLNNRFGSPLPLLEKIKIYFSINIYKSINMLKDDEIDFIWNIPSSIVANFLEENINLFQSKNPVFILEPSNTISTGEVQNIIRANLKGLHSNNMNYIDLTEVFFSKD